MMRWLSILIDALKFRADTVRRLEITTHRAKIAESTLRDYDRKLADAMVTSAELRAQLEERSRPRRRRSSPHNPSTVAKTHGEAVA